MINITAINKPARVTATANAYVETTDAHTYGDIITAALCALNETREMLYGFGIEGLIGFMRPADDDLLPAGRYTVFAYRD